MTSYLIFSFSFPRSNIVQNDVKSFYIVSNSQISVSKLTERGN